MNSITQCCTVYLSFINTGASTDLSRREAKKIKLTTIASHILSFSKAEKLETWFVPTYGNKCLRNFSCQMKRQGKGSLRCFKTKDTRHNKVKYTYIFYTITSFINSETTASVHLMSFTEDLTNIGFHMPIW